MGLLSSSFINCLEQGNRFTIIPDTVKEIGYGAFRGCRGLKRIVIPNSVTKIGTYAFYGCSNLKSIIIPESVAEIGYYAFLGCSSLKHIVVVGNNVYDSRNGCNAIIESETNTLVLGCNYSVIPETVERIKLLAFTKPIGLTRSIITVSDKIKRSFLLHNYLEELNEKSDGKKMLLIMDAQMMMLMILFLILCGITMKKKELLLERLLGLKRKMNYSCFRNSQSFIILTLFVGILLFIVFV